MKDFLVSLLIALSIVAAALFCVFAGYAAGIQHTLYHSEIAVYEDGGAYEVSITEPGTGYTAWHEAK